MQTLEKQELLEKLLEKANKTQFDFREISVNSYEKVLRIREEKTGLDAIISLHSTALGPTLGGTRIQSYSSFEKALEDVLRLSQGMTYKSAVAQVGFGGGKSVIFLNDKVKKTRELLLAFGEAVDLLEGLYICAKDMGCDQDDLSVIAEKTPYIVGLSHEKSSGNPSPYTAWGTFRGVQAALSHLYGSDSLEGKKVVVQGLGSVGEVLCDLLYWHGAELIISDPSSEKTTKIAKKYGASVVSVDRIYQVECDIFCPCAMGGILNEMTIPSLRCKIVAGAANNQLYCNSNADQLRKKGILYAPDFVINSGGLINVACEVEKEGYEPKKARNKTDGIYNTLRSIFDIADQNNQSTHQAAMDLAYYRIKYEIGKREENPHFHHKVK